MVRNKILQQCITSYMCSLRWFTYRERKSCIGPGKSHRGLSMSSLKSKHTVAYHSTLHAKSVKGSYNDHHRDGGITVRSNVPQNRQDKDGAAFVLKNEDAMLSAKRFIHVAPEGLPSASSM